MLNIEKYKNEIMDALDASIACSANRLKGNLGCNGKMCTDCNREALRWLLSEYKEHILDDVEREYLSAVIKPFRKKVKHIVKINLYGSPEEQFIRIVIGNLDFINLPNFNKNTGMYKGMEVDKLYSLEELGL